MNYKTINSILNLYRDRSSIHTLEIKMLSKSMTFFGQITAFV